MASDAEELARNRYAALIEVAGALGGKEDQLALLDLISERVRSLMDAEKATIYLVDEEHKELTSAVLQSDRLAEIRVPLGDSISGRVAKSGKPIILDDAYADPRFDRSFDRVSGVRTRSLLTVPMHSPTRGVIGVLQAMNKRTGSFDGEDAALSEGLAAIAGIALEASALYRDLEATFGSLVETMAAAIDARDRQTAGHSQRVSIYGRAVAREMGYSDAQAELIRMSGLLHDVGKIGVPEAVLTKPGRFTDEERVVMQAHAGITADILGRMRVFGLNQDLPRIAAQHHERPDGQGYPDGLTLEQITPGGRILGVADCFDALTHHRYYRNAMTYDEAYAYMLPLANAQFDPEPLAALGRALAAGGLAALAESNQANPLLSSAPSSGGTTES